MGNVMFMRKGEVHTAPGGLPAGYTKHSYIESSGSQYINTGVKPNQDTRVVICLEVTPKATQSALFGSRTSYQDNSFGLWTRANGAGWQNDYDLYIENVTAECTGKHVFDKNKNVLSIDGEVVKTNNEVTFTGTYDMYLFTINNGGSLMTSYPTYAKLYYCQVWENDILLRDFVPCTTNDGSAGLYDLVEGKFYNNVGSGAFTYGED